MSFWICMNRIFRQSSEKIRKWDFYGIENCGKGPIFTHFLYTFCTDKPLAKCKFL